MSKDAKITKFILTLSDFEFTFEDGMKWSVTFDRTEKSMGTFTDTVSQSLRQKLGINYKDAEAKLKFDRTIRPEIATELIDNKSLILAFANIDPNAIQNEQNEEATEKTDPVLIDPVKELDALIPDRNYLEFVIKIIN